MRLAKKLVENEQFESYRAGIQAILPTHELIILTKFHDEMDLLLIAHFCASLIFFVHTLLRTRTKVNSFQDRENRGLPWNYQLFRGILWYIPGIPGRP